MEEASYNLFWGFRHPGIKEYLLIKCKDFGVHNSDYGNVPSVPGWMWTVLKALLRLEVGLLQGGAS